jgi:hypothetical protein
MSVIGWSLFACMLGSLNSPRFFQQLVCSADPRHERQPTLFSWLTANDMAGDDVIGQSPFVSFEFRVAQHGSQLPNRA